MGNSMNSVQMAATAQKSAVTAMRLVDQPLLAVVEWVSWRVLMLDAMVAPPFLPSGL
jgi:hypothetical protein